MIVDLIKAFFAIFVVMDSLGNLPVFLLCMKGLKNEKRKIMIKQTMYVAGAILLLFLFFGKNVLSFFNVDFKSFQIAGGIIVMIFGIKLVIGLKILEERAKAYRMAVIPLATPLITGPATITTIMIFVHQYGLWLTLLASLLNLWVVYLFLSKAESLYNILGKQGSDVLSKIMGLILTAIAIGFIKQGWV